VRITKTGKCNTYQVIDQYKKARDWVSCCV